jgi:hypothetical protein
MRLLEGLGRILRPEPALELGGYVTVAAWQRSLATRQVRLALHALRQGQAPGRGASGTRRRAPKATGCHARAASERREHANHRKTPDLPM